MRYFKQRREANAAVTRVLAGSESGTVQPGLSGSRKRKAYTSFSEQGLGESRGVHKPAYLVPGTGTKIYPGAKVGVAGETPGPRVTTPHTKRT